MKKIKVIKPGKYYYQIINPDFFTISKGGVYKIFHEAYPKIIYIGSTFASKGFYGRFLAHIRLFERDAHHCKRIQRFVNRNNGVQGLRLQILDICDSDIQAREREIWYLGNLKNVNKYKDVIYEGPKKVYRFDEDGELMDEFLSINNASLCTGISKRTINLVATGYWRSDHNYYYWSFDINQNRPLR